MDRLWWLPPDRDTWLLLCGQATTSLGDVSCLSAVFVRYNQGPAVAVELREEARVAELKEVVGDQQGVRAERLRVIFAGRELRSSATLRVSQQKISLTYLLHLLTVTLTWL